MSDHAHPGPLSPWLAGLPVSAQEALKRLLKSVRLGKGARVLELGCADGEVSFQVARDFGCQVVAADEEDQTGPGLSEKLQAHGLSNRVEFRKVDRSKMPFAEGSFDLIVLCRSLLFSLPLAAAVLRPLLAAQGRLVIGHRTRVGRPLDEETGRGMPSPQQLLHLLAAEGFEPEGLETFGEEAGVSCALLIGRRREPSEPPSTLRR
jgi:SAM-dependent methyltransferase